MTDQETFLAMLRRRGIEPQVRKIDKEDEQWQCWEELFGLTSVQLEEGAHPDIIGYGEFHTVFFFDQDGGFRKVGIWE